MSELGQYDYELPRDLIAQQPLARRSDARLLIVRRGPGSLDHAHVRDLPELLLPGDCLVLNDTRVLLARLVGRRATTGGRWEGLFLSNDEEDNWKLMCKTRGRLTPGETIVLLDRSANEAARLRLLLPLNGGLWAARPESDEQAYALLERIGRVPLPPYIRAGEMVEADRQAYQTVFAEKPGAVAAPTAGLHLTEELLRRLEDRGVSACRVTLHVGLGTFSPIQTERLAEHRMHGEWGSIEADVVERIQQCRAAGGRIVAVGTTVVRVLESAAAKGELVPWSGWTDLFIRPPYTFRATDALMTNFHLPQTTLLVLAQTFGGERLIQHAYQQAIAEQYRFFSYGDAMLIM